MWKHYVYLHRRLDNMEIFYVGKGTHSKDWNFSRAHVTEKRNPIWQHIVAKSEYQIEIFAACQTDKEAQRLEIDLIASLGRKDLGTGSLANMTVGGDGITGLIISDELRKKRSINSSAPRSQAFIAAIRAARKNGGNGGVVKRGDKLSESWVANLSKSKMGNKNPHFGKTTKIARKVVNDFTGEAYPSVSAAALDCKIKMKTLYNMLSGHRPNYTSLRFENGL